jgi:hypothetical protein
MKPTAKLDHHSKYWYYMRQEIEFFCKKLQPLSGILWETPIAHIIPRIPTAAMLGNSCLEDAGGCSISFGF